ncbi:YqjK family protein [uncultured Propionivibrio sp.]|uniref:YqjK family protein n=1 Tax=uncultured Propionivibrio sp. TaxID=426737 RepID=UPI0029C03E61|nr:YqjK family protein [uncultured Propionivibrio sp.]
MMQRLNELHLERGKLLERITTQRYVLINEVQPIRATLDRADHVIAAARSGIETVKRYPALAGVAAALVCILNARRAFRLARRGFFLWRTWRSLRERLLMSGWPGFR